MILVILAGAWCCLQARELINTADAVLSVNIKVKDACVKDANADVACKRHRFLLL